ncbi:MAG: VIT1/CCC1 family protein [Candidatus Hodarchaeota archaeon]
MLDADAEKRLLKAQKNEITEYLIYEKLSQSIKDPHNRNILKLISRDELEHYNVWKESTHKDVEPNKVKIWLFFLISKIFGLTFGIKLMERGEEEAQVTYEEISEFSSHAQEIINDEGRHEEYLIDMINEERLRYAGSIVRGLNEALVELTGALAGFTLALQHTRLVALIGIISGIATSLSMAASEYLATKSEETVLKPIKASLYTSTAHIITVILLIFPYLMFTNIFLALGVTIINAIIAIFIFTYYLSITRDLSLKKRFLEMIVVSLGIAGLTFIIGLIARNFLHLEI